MSPLGSFLTPSYSVCNSTIDIVTICYSIQWFYVMYGVKWDTSGNSLQSSGWNSMIPLQGAQVSFPVRELRSWKPHGQKKKKKKRETWVWKGGRCNPRLRGTDHTVHRGRSLTCLCQKGLCAHCRSNLASLGFGVPVCKKWVRTG